MNPAPAAFPGVLDTSRRLHHGSTTGHEEYQTCRYVDKSIRRDVYVSKAKQDKEQ